MTENLEQFSQIENVGEEQNGAVLPTQTVILEIPPDLAAVLQQRSQYSGQTQAEVLLSLLHSISQLAPESSLESVLEPSTSEILTKEQQKIQWLETRISHLEALLPRLEILEGK